MRDSGGGDPGGGSGAFCGIDPAKFDPLVNEIARAGRELEELARELHHHLATAGVDTAPAQRIGHIAAWARHETPGLRHRAELAHALDKQQPHLGGADGGGFVRLPSDKPQAVDKELRALHLADKLNAVHHTSPLDGKRLHSIAKQLSALGSDPEVNAAFWSQVDPKLTNILAGMLPTDQDAHASGDMAAFSRSFCAATHAKHPPAGYHDLMKQYLSPAGTGVAAWNRLMLLQYGTADTGIHTAAISGLLDHMANAEHPGTLDLRADSAQAGAYGVSPDALGLALGQMKGDPAFIRAVFDGDEHAGSTAKLKAAMNYGVGIGGGSGVPAQLGALINEAAGVGTEQPGEHGPATSQFAFHAILAMGKIGEKMPPSAQQDMSALAASYRHEMLAGASFDNDASRAPSIKEPTDWSEIPGNSPSFYLSRKKIYAFLKTFAGSPAATSRYDEAMGQLQHHLLVHAAHLDANAVRHGKDASRFHWVAGRLGDLGGLEYAAQLKVRGDMDAEDAEFRSIVGGVITKGVGKIPVPQAQAAKYTWMVTKFGLNKAIGALSKEDPDDTRVARTTTVHDQAVLASSYHLAQTLMDANYPIGSRPPTSLTVGHPPRLKPFGEIAGNTHLMAEFNEWLARTEHKPGTHTRDPNGFGSLIDDASHERTSDNARAWAAGLDGES